MKIFSYIFSILVLLSSLHGYASEEPSCSMGFHWPNVPAKVAADIKELLTQGCGDIMEDLATELIELKEDCEEEQVPEEIKVDAINKRREQFLKDLKDDPETFFNFQEFLRRHNVKTNEAVYALFHDFLVKGKTF